MRDIACEFVGLSSPTQPRAGAGGHPCQGLYWTPRAARPKIAVIATHYNVDFAEHYIAPYFAQRGIGFLGWNTRFRGAEDLFSLDHALIDIGVGMTWLREEVGVERIVLLGNSGGGSLMAAYQAEAQTPTLPASARTKDALSRLPRADLYISLNAHPGRPDVLTNWMDASVLDENDPVATDAALDPFNPANGPPYSAAFIARYRDAQRARNQRITDWAKRELARLNAAGIPDRIFPLFRTWADLRFMDPAIDPSERPCPGTGVMRARLRSPIADPSVSGAPTRCARGFRCGVSRHRFAGANDNWRNSPCPPWSYKALATWVCSPATQIAFSPPSIQRTKRSSFSPARTISNTIPRIATPWPI